MKKNYKSGIKIWITAILLFSFFYTNAQTQPQWPTITQQNKPWSRWWWEGSAVDTTNLSWILKQYQQAGLGGLEITPIYGVKGQESKFINFTSPKWMDMLTFTLKDAKKLGLGIDMAQASGWPFGGPWVKDEDASKYFTFNSYQLKTGEEIKMPILFEQKALLRQEGQRVSIDQLKEPIASNPNLQLYAFDQVQFPKQLSPIKVMAYADNGEILDISNKLDAQSNLQWKAPKGNWTIYAIFEGLHGKMVERAGPGGEGYAIDHFSLNATQNYLHHFDEAFKGYDISYLRGFFNDSYEVDDARGEANWTPAFFSEFNKRRGYPLQNYLPELLGKAADKEKSSRVLTDYRQTISDLLLEHYTEAWHSWAHQKGKIIRNQAHGSPANILDLYGATDIPEAEGSDVLRIKFASSAAHVTGKPFASSESATWENDHFLSKLKDVKKAMDVFFLGGINHTFYHGANYTPQDAKWPGWLFYAAVHFTPNNSFWTDFPALNNYVARVQSFLQSGKPANDILLYLPMADSYADRRKSLLKHYDGLTHGFSGTIVEETAQELYNKGYSFDYISDAQLQNCTTANGEIITANLKYKTIIVPGANLMSLATMEKLFALTKAGAKIVFYKNLPGDVPGLGNLTERQSAFSAMINELNFVKYQQFIKADLANGEMLTGADLSQLMLAAKVSPEPMNQMGIKTIKRRNDKGAYYFVLNDSDKAIDGWIAVNAMAKSVALFNPMTGKNGFAAAKTSKEGLEVYLQLAKGESCILQTFEQEEHQISYAYTKQLNAINLDNKWQLNFIAGGPTLPKSLSVDKLQSWVNYGEDYTHFSGTASYTTIFKKSKAKAAKWLLQMGKVEESAKVILNGEEIATLIGPDYSVEIPQEKLKKQNTLEIKVSNGMANRIEWMDKTNQNYKIFYNINMPAHASENRGQDGLFTSKNWSPKPSGLLGEVKLIPLEIFDPNLN